VSSKGAVKPGRTVRRFGKRNVNVANEVQGSGNGKLSQIEKGRARKRSSTRKSVGIGVAGKGGQTPVNEDAEITLKRELLEKKGGAAVQKKKKSQNNAKVSCM